MSIASCCIACSFVVALSVAAPAQPPPFSDGPMAVMPATFSVHAGTSLGASDDRAAQPYFKPRGFTPPGTPPPPLSTPTVDFSVSALFRACTPATGRITSGPVPEVDACSLGLDVISATPAGDFVVPINHWDGAAFSVRDGTVGVTGSRINDELSRPGGNRADFFGFVFPRSSCLPPEAQGQTFKMGDSLDIGLPLDAEIDAVDVYMNLYALGSPVLANLPAKPSFYFSLEGSAANTALAPDSWWGGTTKSGATIFKSDWTGSSWTCPAVYLTASDLGISECEDVDAVALEPGSKIVFSTSTRTGAGCPQRDQLLFLTLSVDGAIPVTATTGGRSLADEIGLVPGNPTEDVDAVCIFDPICSGNRALGSQVAMENTLGYPWSTPVPGFPFPRTIEAQVYRAPAPGPNYQYDLYALGGPPGGIGVWMFSTPGLWPQFPLHLPFQIPLASPHAGHPVSLQLALPPNVRGADLTVQVFTLPRSGPVVFGQSHPVVFLLR